ncbi:MAG: MBL fold metallo-hydrolase, partial [Sphaerochaetaceae bacterium]|nr:MBL fold metallo-hydrolase [Sphaerochaetaceae bacterium]
ILILTVLCSCSQRIRPADYAIPWNRDVVSEAVQTHTINFYFMSGSGMVIEENAENAKNKWGDSCLVVLPDGTTLLIDSGMYQYADVLKENLHKLGVDRLDYLVISHPHNDHASGVYEKKYTILKEFEVGHCYLNGTYNTNWKNVHKLEDLLDKYHVPFSHLSEGDAFDIGTVHFSVINPPKSILGTVYDNTADVNNSSMVLRMDYGEFSALFTGDIYAAKEAQLVAAYSDVLDVDLLKIPHHGYSTSNTTAFANATSPVVAVATGYVQMPLSVCNNYRKSGAQVLFDYVDGYIHVWSDVMQNIGWETSKERTGLFQDRYGRAEFIPEME